MQIDSGGGAWGADAGDVKNEDNRGRGRRDDNVKDERERGGAGAWGGDGGGAAWGNDGGGRGDYDMQSPGGGYRGGRDGGRGGRGGGRGGGDRGPMTCYNCQGEGHMSRECPEPRKERGGGGGGDRPPMKCYNCQGEGH